MEKIYSFELWLVDERGAVVSKINANYPGKNSFIALLNFMHGISQEPDAVKNLGTFEIQRLHISVLKQIPGLPPANFGVEEMRERGR